MNIKENKEIETILKRLKKGMVNYISENTSYGEADVDVCMSILTDFLDHINASETKEEGMELVKNAVLALNELNENCGAELIETDQREDICEIIILAGSILGYNDMDEDITEEWREW